MDSRYLYHQFQVELDTQLAVRKHIRYSLWKWTRLEQFSVDIYFHSAKNAKMQKKIVRLNVKTPCSVNLKMFPFDSLSCEIVLESYSFNAAEVRLNWHDFPITMMEKVILSLKLLSWLNPTYACGFSGRTTGFRLNRLANRASTSRIPKWYLGSSEGQDFFFFSFKFSYFAITSRTTRLCVEFSRNFA